MLSMPLKAEATSLMRFSLWAGKDASQTDPETENPFSFHSFKHAFSSSSFLEQVYTVAPNSASSSTTARLNQKWNPITPIKKLHTKNATSSRFNKPQNQETQTNSCNKWNPKKKRKTEKKIRFRKRKKKKRNPIPRVPPVTRAVVPLSDHLEALPLPSGFAIAISFCSRSYLVSSEHEELERVLCCLKTTRLDIWWRWYPNGPICGGCLCVLLSVLIRQKRECMFPF